MGLARRSLITAFASGQSGEHEAQALVVHVHFPWGFMVALRVYGLEDLGYTSNSQPPAACCFHPVCECSLLCMIRKRLPRGYRS